jgi:hypothetical protein
MSAYQSQNAKVLAHLESGESITSWEAIQKWRITRLARVIDDLKKLGKPIQSELLRANGKVYARYWLPKGQLALFNSQPDREIRQGLGAI